MRCARTHLSNDRFEETWRCTADGIDNVCCFRTLKACLEVVWCWLQMQGAQRILLRPRFLWRELPTPEVRSTVDRNSLVSVNSRRGAALTLGNHVSPRERRLQERREFRFAATSARALRRNAAASDKRVLDIFQRHENADPTDRVTHLLKENSSSRRMRFAGSSVGEHERSLRCLGLSPSRSMRPLSTPSPSDAIPLSRPRPPTRPPAVHTGMLGRLIPATSAVEARASELETKLARVAASAARRVQANGAPTAQVARKRREATRRRRAMSRVSGVADLPALHDATLDAGVYLHPCLRQRGRCSSPGECPFLHIPAQICLQFLQNGRCEIRECPWVHSEPGRFIEESASTTEPQIPSSSTDIGLCQVVSAVAAIGKKATLFSVSHRLASQSFSRHDGEQSRHDPDNCEELVRSQVAAVVNKHQLCFSGRSTLCGRADVELVLHPTIALLFENGSLSSEASIYGALLRKATLDVRSGVAARACYGDPEDVGDASSATVLLNVLLRLTSFCDSAQTVENTAHVAQVCNFAVATAASVLDASLQLDGESIRQTKTLASAWNVLLGFLVLVLTAEKAIAATISELLTIIRHCGHCLRTQQHHFRRDKGHALETVAELHLRTCWMNCLTILTGCSTSRGYHAFVSERQFMIPELTRVSAPVRRALARSASMIAFG